MSDETTTPHTIVSSCAGVCLGIGVLLTHDGDLVAAGPLAQLPDVTGLICLVHPDDYELIARCFRAAGLTGDLPPSMNN